MSLVDVVVPMRNTRDLSTRCIDAARSRQVHCVVIDNASDDGTADAIESLWPDVTVVRSKENLGYGRACNTGARHGTGEFILILNSDAIARPGAVERLAQYLVERPDHSAAAGQLVHLGTDEPQVGFAVRGFPTLANQVALMLGLQRYWPRNPISRGQLMLDFDYGRTQELVAQPAGACLMVRRNDFDAVGGFDEGFFYWFEDVDLVRRLRTRGPIGYVHDAVFEHAGGASFALWTRPEVVVARYDGLLRYFLKHHSRADVLALRAVVFALAAVRVPLLALRDRPSARAYAGVARRSLRRV
jgi:N-acetylglucosaminyl-diphospho-decaprenol L-rhamnosyltransferase